MALSFVQYTGDGTNKVFNVTFQYLQQANVFVKVDDVTVTFTFLDSGRVELTNAPASGATVEIRRNSDRTARVVDYQDGAVLTEAALDADSNQIFHLAQEAFDASDNTLQLDFDGLYDATSKRIKNVADPVNAQDAVTKTWAETEMTSQLVGTNGIAASFHSNSYTGDGSTVAFAMDYVPNNRANTQVFIDGVYQNKLGYSYVSTTLTFSEAPPLNSSVEIVVARSLNLVTAATSSVGDITELLALSGGVDEQVVHVSDPVRGGTFIYDAARSTENDGGLIFNGWVRQYHGLINSSWYTSHAASVTALDGVERVDGALWQSLSDGEGQGAIWKYGKNDQRGWNSNPYDAVTEPTGYATNEVSYVFLHDFKPKFANGNRTDGANVYLGGRAGSFSAAPDAAAVGNYNIHCSYNTAVGHQAINNLTTAYNCTATGVNAGRYLTEGYGNTFNGRDAAHATTIGHYNCAMGQSALFSNTVGYENIAIGVTAMRDVGGNQNIGIGVDSLFNAATGNKNIGIGYQAGYGITSGNDNTFIGQTPIANYPNGAQSGLLVISAGAVPRIQGDSSGKLSLSGDVPTATLEYRTTDTTVYNGSEAGGQVDGGSTLLMANDSSINNGISQLVLQPRSGKPVCRIVATDGLTSTLRFVTNDTEKVFITSNGALRPTNNNAQQLGGGSNRWSVVFAGTGTINTSDDREKTYEEITETEKAVALELKANMRKFKYNDAIELKGLSNARSHFGASAQTVKSIFESHGLVAEDYGILCHDEWEDEEGVTKDIYGIRYDELLSFIIGAM